MKTNVLRFISTVLVLSICLTILPSFPAFAQEPFVQTVTPIDPEYISLQQLQTMVLPEEDRPEAVESYLVEQKGHVLRLREQEEDLNTVVFQNRDGNKTMYYFDQPVKYVDENGNIKDKKTTVTSVIDKAEYSADYGFVTSDNDIKTYFPKKLVGNKGILVEYQDVKIEVIPLSAEKNVLSSAQKKQDLVDSQTRDSVEYNKAFGNNTLLKYTPTFGGFKEDIILASYAGKNEFSFKIKTNGLALVCEDGKYYLADPATNEKLMQVGDIVVYDSSMVPNTTPSVPVLNPVKPEPKELTEEEKNALYFPEGPLDPVYEHYYQLETVKEAEEYVLTIVVDEDYLTCEDTVYPVTIDPSLTVVGSSFLDTTIYTNYSSAQGSSLNMFVGNHATRYGGTRGVARALIRFPGLFSNSTFASLSADDISHVDFMIRDTMCEGDGVWIDCYRLTQSWSESTAVYSSSLWNGYVGFIDDEYVQYNGGTGSDGTGTGHWYHFNITNVVKEWLDGYYGGVSNHYGIMLKAFEETDPAKTFGTSENADYPPKVVVDYDDNSGGGDNGGGSTAVTSVQFSQDEYVVPVGWSGTFNVIVNPAGAVSGGFNWVLIGAQDIATINYTTGVFTALAEGTKTLFVGAKNGGTGDSCTIRIVNMNISQDAYNAGVRWGFYDGVCMYDYTIPINNLFDSAKALCEEHRCMNWTQYCQWIYNTSPLLQPDLSQHLGMTLGSFTWFYGQVNHGAVWDIKRESCWNNALPNVPYLGQQTSFLFRGYKVTAEDMGNIMYGYTGRATGFGSITLYWGGGVAKQGSLNNAEVSTPPNYGDDPNDHEKIELGYNLFESDHPDYPEVGYDGIPVEEGIIAAVGDLILNPGT